MKYHTYDCVDCGLPCLFEGCPYYDAEHFECDCCGEVDVKLYHYNGNEVCIDCLLKDFEVVEGSEDL